MSKYLINSDFVALRKGDFVEAAEEAGEFIFDTENPHLAKGALEEVAAANKIEASKSLRKDKYEAAVIEGLEKLKLSEVNKMTNTEIVEGIVKKGYESGATDEDMLVEIIQEGIKFKEAGKLFQQVTQKLGLRVSPKERKEAVAEILDEAEFDPENWDEVAKMAEHLSNEISDTSERQAISAMKVWAKANEVELPKKPSRPKGVTVAGVGGLRGKLLQFMLDNRDFSKDDLVAKAQELKPDQDKEKSENTAKRMMSFVQFAELWNDDADASQEA